MRCLRCPAVAPSTGLLEWLQANVQCRRTGGVQQAHQHARADCHEEGRENWHVHDPEVLQEQMARSANNPGREEGDLRQEG
eukprot:8423044-Lingulodinium_polyedra.AAC.1